ncbi:MAG: Maf family protein [Planctomycetota bacterium]
MPQMILASTSKYRRELLQRLVPEFVCQSPGVDENSWFREGRSPAQLATLLAAAKAESVFSQHPDAVVIGSDQVVDLNGRTLGKPGSREASVTQLSQLSGQTHRLLTAVCVCSPEIRYELLHITTLRMRALSLSEIHRYVDRDQPFDCAGSYQIESLGISLFDAIETTDFTSIMGLPLMPLASHLRSLGINVP